MRIVHILRKYDPTEWGGTETAMRLLLAGLRAHQVESVVYCPALEQAAGSDPLAADGAEVKRFRACLPVWGLPVDRRRQLIAVGGNLMSFDLAGVLKRERDVQAIHTHALGRLGGIAAMAAQAQNVPLVVTIHGGVLDLPESLRRSMNTRETRGIEWGRIFGWRLKARRLLERADAILTCNPREAALLKERYPDRRIVVQPHGVPLEKFAVDCREAVWQAYPQIRGSQIVLSVGRIDPVKNQSWLIEQATAILQRHPRSVVVLAGACTDAAYGEALQRRIVELGLADRVLVTGGLPPGDPRLVGLMQAAAVVALPSISETFGLVILEAWAAGAAVISSRTSGAIALIEPGTNGWLFSLDEPESFQTAVDEALGQPELATRFAEAGRRRVAEDYNSTTLAGRVARLYAQLADERRRQPHQAFAGRVGEERA